MSYGSNIFKERLKLTYNHRICKEKYLTTDRETDLIEYSPGSSIKIKGITNSKAALLNLIIRAALYFGHLGLTRYYINI